MTFIEFIKKNELGEKERGIGIIAHWWKDYKFINKNNTLYAYRNKTLKEYVLEI